MSEEGREGVPFFVTKSFLFPIPLLFDSQSGNIWSVEYAIHFERENSTFLAHGVRCMLILSYGEMLFSRDCGFGVFTRVLFTCREKILSDRVLFCCSICHKGPGRTVGHLLLREAFLEMAISRANFVVPFMCS